MPRLRCSCYMSVVRTIAETIEGTEALADWLGDGGVPVNPILAEMRAGRCSIGNDGRKCPLNVHPGWWDKAKHAVANWIRRELEIKNNMRLRVSSEDNLAMCKACGCCLQLKIWTPAKHLREHVTKEQINTTPSYCWMRRELL